MFKKIAFVILAVFAGTAPVSADYKKGIDPVDARLVGDAFRTLQLGLAAMINDPPDVVISASVVVYSEKADDGEDGNDQTLSCHGDTESEALWCSEMLAEVVAAMDEPDQWLCDSTSTGADCTHIPH